MNFWKSLAVGAAFSVAVTANVNAAPLVQVDPMLEGAGSTFDIFDFGGGVFDVVPSFFENDVTGSTGVALTSPTLYSLFLTLDTGDLSNSSGDLLVTDDGVDFLTGSLTSIDTSSGAIEALFSNTGGSAESAFTSLILATITFPDAVDTVLDDISTSGYLLGGVADVKISSVQPIPLPGGLVLLLAGLGGLAVIRRRAA